MRCTSALSSACVLWFALIGVTHAQSTPIRANDFLNSIGVDTHIVQGIDDPKRVGAALTYAGFRHVREDASHSRSVLDTLIEIHKATGVTFDELPIVDSDSADIPDSLTQYEQLASAGALMSVEGPNEPNNFPLVYRGAKSEVGTTFSPVAHYQRDLYAAIKADPKLARYPVFASSEGGAEPDNQGLQFLTVPPGRGTVMPAGTVYADYANLHNYLHGNGMTAPIDNTAWGAEADGAPEGTWDGLFGEYGVTWHKHFAGYSVEQLRRLQKVTTESGWQTRGPGSIDEVEQGKLLTNLFLAAAARKWSYTFVYMLVDEPQLGNGYFGVFRRDYTPKAAAIYLHDLTTILADTSSAFRPTPFVYSILGKSTTVHDLPLQKSNGVDELAVWDERINGSDRVIVNLGGRVSAVRMYDVTKGTAPIREFRNPSSIPLTLSDHAVILEFTSTKVRAQH